MRPSIRPVIVVLLLIVALPSAGPARADLKATAVVYAFDVVALRYQNSNVVVHFNGAWIPFLHEIGFDSDPWTGACGPGTSTTWAGTMEYGLYHADDAPLNAPGFQETRSWSLVSCDRDGDGGFDNDDLRFLPPTAVTPYPGGVIQVLSQDVVTACSTGNCKDEIVTTILVNMDVDCDGTMNADVPPGGVCFYAEARTPPPPSGGPGWSGPLQARITTAGGDKTVNFNVDTTAVDLLSFSAERQDSAVLLRWVTTTEVDNAGFYLYRAEAADGAPVPVNDVLIPAHMPGSVIGSQYSYLDPAVVAGVVYYYWLEDVDTYGSYARHGPIAAVVPVDRPYTAVLPAVQR